jgi:hypothetical protein
MFQSGIEVLGRPDIVASVFEAPQDINKNRHKEIFNGGVVAYARFILIYSLSRWRERARVRVDIISMVFPSLPILRHPAFPDLCKAERDSILSPEGRGDLVV